ncbi:23S rRNA (guanine(745)-N(1))-methyltransferase [Vibrio sonorensis]|uniref:23S rRNA (guanine(745)-N(1))-methyltransferase n=1 Tax=Vibrio sonorensis TaxID=1004316 RepID=UPI0008DA52CD|nr:23S rRNA (guanine(745)-N(1))-methyltransferase [Vibrio sonorensis]
MAYQCPLCQQPLSLRERSLQCESNHQFDMAKEGYVNLMPAHHKRSKDPGDNKEMMQARREFLSQNHYQPMRDRVATLCSELLSSDTAHLLDIGCGEGYYTEEVNRRVTQEHPLAQVYGLDISKVAIRYAAKRYKSCHFSVASSHRLPFIDHSLDAVLRIYAPCKADELSRVIKSKGYVITVTPGARHLYQLREKIYQDVRLHNEQVEQLDGFELVKEESLNYTMSLSDGGALQLLQMTPFAWKANDELRTELQSATLFECEADFVIRVFQKNS